MKLINKIASLILMAGFLIYGTNFNVFAAEEREVNEEYKTIYREDLIMSIVEEGDVIRIFSLSKEIEWEATKTDEVVYTSCSVFARKHSPNISDKDELCLPEGTEIHRIGVSDNGWDIIEYEGDKYFMWYNCITQNKPEYIPQEVDNEEYVVAGATREQDEDNEDIVIEDQPFNICYEVEEEPEQTYIGTFELTAYCATGNPCADGVYPSVGYTVACNDSRLWHHWIYIEGYGTYYVHDTGGMASNVIDIFMGSYDECIQFGRQSANVYIVD